MRPEKPFSNVDVNIPGGRHNKTRQFSGGRDCEEREEACRLAQRWPEYTLPVQASWSPLTDEHTPRL